MSVAKGLRGCDMYIGIDLGGTKIEAVALSEGGDELFRKRVPTPLNDYPAGIAAICRLVGEIELQQGKRGSVGLGIPGTISPATGLVKNANSTWLIGQRLDQDIAHALQREVRVANDANCFAISEAIDGAGAGHTVVFGVILGSGCGGGIVVDRRVIRGRHHIAGEWGHNPLPWPTPDELPGNECYCGKKGCLETYISGNSIAREHHKMTGEKLRLQEIIDHMRAGDMAAQETYGKFIDRLARGLATVIDILDPDVVILGGGVSNIDEIYADLPEKLSERVFSDICETPVKKALHGDSSGVRGAAWLWAG